MTWIITKDKAGCSAIYDEKANYEIASHLDRVDAEFIIKACNSFHSNYKKLDCMFATLKTLENLIENKTYTELDDCLNLIKRSLEKVDPIQQVA